MTPETLKRDLEIVPGKKSDYKSLGQYHYIEQKPAFTRKVYIVRPRSGQERYYPNPLGVMVYAPPFPNLKPRNTATNNIFNSNPSKKDRLSALNKHVTMCSRLVIDPRYKKCGLGFWLLEETLKLQNYSIIEALSPIDFTNDMFIKLGFKLFYNPAPTWYHLFINELESIGITGSLLEHPKMAFIRINSLAPGLLPHAKSIFNRFVAHFQKRRSMAFSVDKVRYAFTKIPYPQAYMIRFRSKLEFLKLKH